MIDRYADKLIFTNEELPQGSDEWKAFREAGIGGSEVSVLMHCNPFSNIQQLWRKRLGLESSEFNSNMQRGNELEATARARYEQVTGHKMEPLVLIHPRHRYIHTSLDGISEDRSVLVEIKCAATKSNWQRFTQNNQVPNFRYPQIQQQLAIAYELFGTEKAHYWCYYDEQYCGGTDGQPIEVQIDHDYVKELIRRIGIFYTQFLCGKRTPPPYLFKEEPQILRAA